ncbi:MAG: hypothetical protein ABH954_04600, partial [Candidatus Omnitrophota bacterium]
KRKELRMIKIIISQLIAIGFYLSFVFFSFCDGFNVRPLRKIAWAIIFFWICIVSLRFHGSFDLVFILPLTSVLAVFLCWFEKRSRAKKE